MAIGNDSSEVPVPSSTTRIFKTYFTLPSCVQWGLEGMQCTAHQYGVCQRTKRQALPASDNGLLWQRKHGGLLL